MSQVKKTAILSRPDWLEQVEVSLGRPLRVLHVGNIANNGYQNAKIMRRAGIDADCIAYDYYHVMGAAEWEDAEFSGPIGDPFFPDWWRVRLKGFTRPKWFVQGPRALCLEYLRGRYGEDPSESKGAWDLLHYESHRYSYRNSKLSSFPLNPLGVPKWALRKIEFWLYTLKVYTGHRKVFHSRRQAAIPFWVALLVFITLPVLVLILGIYYISEKLVSIIQNNSGGTQSKLSDDLQRARKSFTQKIIRLLFPLMTKLADFLHVNVRKLTGRRITDIVGEKRVERLRQLIKVSKTAEIHETDVTSQLDAKWISNHYDSHSEKGEALLKKDVEYAQMASAPWRGIFEMYDVVLGYSTDGVLIMAGSDVPYYTYSHGTLRSIPFEDTVMGRLCASSYRNCNQLMITNMDNLDKPKRLGLKRRQVIYLPHAVDDAKLLNFQKKHSHIQPENHDRPMFFCPARHDWGDENPSLMKGNDKLLKALKIIYSEGHRPRVILLDWGRHVEKSRELIEILGISSLVDWVKPMKKSNLWKYYLECHAIVDQFSLPAFGGIAFEGLTFSKRIITYFDEKEAEAFFGAPAPLMNARTPETIAVAMCRVLSDPEDKAGIGRAAGQWAKTYHSSQRILDLQLAEFKYSLTQDADKATTKRRRNA